MPLPSERRDSPLRWSPRVHEILPRIFFLSPSTGTSLLDNWRAVLVCFLPLRTCKSGPPSFSRASTAGYCALSSSSASFSKLKEMSPSLFPFFRFSTFPSFLRQGLPGPLSFGSWITVFPTKSRLSSSDGEPDRIAFRGKRAPSFLSGPRGSFVLQVLSRFFLPK